MPARFRRPVSAGQHAARLWLPALFALVALPVLVMFALAVPTGEVPDEVAHILRADSVRHGEIAGFRSTRLDEQGNPAIDVAVHADGSLLLAGFEFRPGAPLIDKHVSRHRLDELLGMSWANRFETVSIPNTAVYPPIMYLPAAAGLEAAKLAGAGPYASILFARLVNAALYLAAGLAALALAWRGRTILFAVLCLPMSLALAASVNQDGVVIACAALAAALLTRSSLRAWWFGVLLFGLAAMAKPFLLPLVLIVPATMPDGVRRAPGRALAGVALALVPALAWGAAMATFVAAPFVRGPAQPGGPLYAGPPGTVFATTNPGEQLHILLADPYRLLSLPIDSAWDKGEWLWREVVGVLGTLDVLLPIDVYDWWVWALGAALLAGLLANPFRLEGRRVLPGLAALLGLVCAVWMAYLLQYLSWTRVGDAVIDGIQGRYFIPVAALALPVLAFAEQPSRLGSALRTALSLPVVLIAVADVAILPLTVLNAYYIR